MKLVTAMVWNIKKLRFIKEVNKNKNGKSFSPDWNGILFLEKKKIEWKAGIAIADKSQAYRFKKI